MLITVSLSAQPVTSYQCGDQPDKFGWLWPEQGIVAEDANLGA